MALDLTPEQKAIGKDNFHRVVGKLAATPEPGGMTRRRFMQGLIAAGAALPITAAAYFGYTNSAFRGKPVKAGLIGAGDEGGVLVGEHNPEYLRFIAYSDIRPSNQTRIFSGDPQGGVRKGFNYHYGSDARRRITLYQDYRELLANPEIEMVVIALPLHLHAQATIDALNARKHVLCEKLMAWNIRQCKQMIQAADANDRLLSIGHQRHYSMLYQHAVEVINSAILGEIRHIRALWHRANATPILDGNGRPQIDSETGQTRYRDSWRPEIKAEDRAALESRIREQYGYKNMSELVRWRLYKRTGGGLMAELGSHQLDACSIFLGKVHPLAVSAVGGKNFYQDDREVEDHVYCTYEFPGKNYDRNRAPRRPDGTCDYSDVVSVTYSSISTNGFEPYGECVMGTKGTLIIESEQNAYLWGNAGRSTSVTATTGGGGPRLDSSASTPDAGERRALDTGSSALGATISRGYREEMEHMAYLIRAREKASEAERRNLVPRCDGRAAMADAIIALTANQAMKHQRRIVFEDAWYRAETTDVPDADMRPETI
ncbi:MAG: Gfo/Idh/MocA family oxidoreductase [Planctomycetes bacterium]|nr:Gfo/Idh/MocA family oxidoreductase [Planctomycetota bacterium]